MLFNVGFFPCDLEPAIALHEKVLELPWGLHDRPGLSSIDCGTSCHTVWSTTNECI